MSGLCQDRTEMGVIGGGAWGTALGIHCARMGHKVLLWAREPEVRGSSNWSGRTHVDIAGGKHSSQMALECMGMTFKSFFGMFVLQVVESINGPARENSLFLPGVHLGYGGC